MGKRISIFIYGLTSYALFFATFLYAIGFVGNFLVPRTIDGTPLLPLWQALLVNMALLLLFAVQHSVMARPVFKRWITRFIPEAAERSTYVLLSSVALIVLFALWQPMGGMVWQVTNVSTQIALYTLFVLGWSTVLVSTFLINHFDLFGLRQVWFALRDKPYRPLKFTTPGPYRWVRHPLYVGWLLAFWATPTMSATHLLFALVTTAYILVAIRFEERDLIAAHPEYKAYQREVPMLLPRKPHSKNPGRLVAASR